MDARYYIGRGWIASLTGKESIEIKRKGLKDRLLHVLIHKILKS